MQMLERAGLPARLSGTLALAALGGGIFAWIGTPLAWMLGAMFFVTAASLAGAPTHMSLMLRKGMLAILGIMLGSSFRPEIAGQAIQWLPSMGVMIGFMALITTLSYQYLRRVAGMDTATAYFSSAPGGLTEMIMVGESMGGNPATISLVHATRILVVVGTIPVYFRYIEGLNIPAMPPGPSGLPELLDVALLTACALIGVPLAAKLKLPAGALLGPMLLSAILHIGGLTSAAPPSPVVAVAQIVIGAGIGCRFAGLSLASVWRTILFAAGSGLMMVIAATLTGILVGPVIGDPPKPLILALAPGGLAEMSLIALSIGSLTAYISFMHLARIVLVVIIFPSIFRILTGARMDGPPP
ncbi:MAG TPA: AbrB family transcriptional regulator [Alphaproteobacteria bacterium]|nr:AbrB family transcriptional regulator [Alphaproteobacteria bacterium]